MATCRTALAGALALALSGCGASVRPPGTVSPSSASSTRPNAPNAPNAAFAWLRPQPAPADWSSVRLASGAGIDYPPGWRAIPGDRGTVSAATLDRRGRYLGYLNVTPRQGQERAEGWASFRIRHNAAEGDRRVQLEAAAGELRFRSGRGACVHDAYTTAAGTRYEEIACLVQGRRESSVVVGAGLESSWPRERTTIERAISALTT
jgi:hypothetical protein